MSQPWVPPTISKPISFQWRGEEQRKLHQLVNADCADMDEYAKSARDSAKVAIQGYMALTRKTYANRSDIFPPTIHAVVYSRISQEAANIPKVEYKARKKASEPKMKTLNAALRNVEQGDGHMRPHSLHQWFHQNFDKVLFGTGFRYQGYLLQTRVINIKDDQGKWKEVKSIVHDDIVDLVPDFFHIGVSRDMQPGMFGGSSCYWDRYYSRDAFIETFDTPFYQNIKAVTQSPWFSSTTYIRVRFYWHLYKDLYYVEAMPMDIAEDVEEMMDQAIPIREDYILDYGDPSRPVKFLPISSIHNEVAFDMKSPDVLSTVFQGGRPYTPYSEAVSASGSKTFWSKSDPMLIKALVGFKKALWGAAADHTKASSVHFLLSGSAGVLDQINSATLYGIMPLKAEPNAFDVKSLTEGSGFMQKWTEMDEAVDSAMTYSLGNDWRRAATELTNEKATVAAIRQQVQRLRANFNAKFNESGPISRHYRITLNLIQQYYPEPTEMDIDGEIPEDVEEEDIIRDPDGHPIKYKKRKELPIDVAVVEIKKNGKYTLVSDDSPELPDGKRGNGEKVFKSRDVYLRTQEEPEVYIEPASSFAELKALERSLEVEKQNSYQFWLGLQYPTGESDPMGQPVIKPLIPKEGAEYLLERFAEKFEDDPDKLLARKEKDELGDEEDDIKPAFQMEEQQRQQMTQGQPPPGQPGQQPNGMAQGMMGKGPLGEQAANMMQL
jgi:hypothetical protein